MSASNREASISITLGYEGGYTNHPSDPGGPTNWGITIHDARLYWKKDATAADVKAMPKSVAIDIYRQKYWAKMNCDADPAGVDLVTFDYGVNSGTGRAVPVRSKCKKADPVEWVKAICDERLAFLHRLKTWSVFGKGWGARVANVKARGVKMALQGSGVPAPQVKKKLEDEAKSANKAAKANGTAATTTTAGPAATQVPDTPIHVDLSTVGLVVLGIVVVSAALYFGLRWWKSHQEAQAYAQVAKET